MKELNHEVRGLSLCCPFIILGCYIPPEKESLCAAACVRVRARHEIPERMLE